MIVRALLAVSRSFALSAATVALLVTPVAVPTAAHSAFPPEIADPFDHTTCFRMQDESRFSAIVDLEVTTAGLELPPGCKVVKRGRLYCSPTRKTVRSLRYRPDSEMSPIEMPGHDRSQDRICYRLKCPAELPDRSLLVQDQFGRRALRAFEVRLLCTNAVVVSATTTTSTTNTTVEPTDPCAVVDCSPDHFCRPTCDDPRVPECVPLGNEGDVCGGFVPPCAEERCGAGLVCRVPIFVPDAPGECVPEGTSECLGDDDCAQGLVCVDAGEFIPGGSVCIGGCRGDEDCDEAQLCVPTPCPGPPCADQCVDDAGCGGDDECADGEVCEPSAPFDPRRNVCVPGCREDLDCGEGRRCEEVVCITTPCPPHCVEDPGCERDGDCADDEVCEPSAPSDPRRNVCVPGCRADEDCGESRRCEDVICTTTPCPPRCVDDEPRRCEGNADCPDGEICSLDGTATSPVGICTPAPPPGCGACVSDGECPDGTTCDSDLQCLVSCDCPLCAVCAGNCVP